MDEWLSNTHHQSRSSNSSSEIFYDFNSFGAELGYKEEDHLEFVEAAADGQNNFLMEFGSSEIGLEMSALDNIDMQMDLDSFFAQSPSHYSDPLEFFPSSSSSHRSLSIESPENPSFNNNSSGSSLPDTPTTFLPSQQEVHSKNIFTKFPDFKSEDLMITKAISEVLSTPSSSTFSMHLTSSKPNPPHLSEIGMKKQGSSGHKIIKGSISHLRKLDLSNSGGSEDQGSRMSSHMISERRRRETLNESFYNLGMILPPSCKKDKASVLCNAKDYLKTLEAEISELRRKNQVLEMYQIPREMSITDVKITKASEWEIGIQRISLKITVRLVCELIELVLHALEYLKKRRAISFQSLDAESYLVQEVELTSATLVFDIKVVDWDEESFREGMINVVDIANMTQ